MKKSDNSSLHQKVVFIMIAILALGIGYYITDTWHTEEKQEAIEALEDFKANSIKITAVYDRVSDSSVIKSQAGTFKYYIADYQFTVDGDTFSTFQVFSENDTIPNELPIFYHKDSPEMNSFDIDYDIERLEYDYAYGDKKKSPGKAYFIGLVVIVLCYANYKLLKKYFWSKKS